MTLWARRNGSFTCHILRDRRSTVALCGVGAVPNRVTVLKPDLHTVCKKCVKAQEEESMG